MSVTTTTTPAQTGEEPGTNNGGVTGGTTATAQNTSGTDQQQASPSFTQHQVNAYLGARIKEERAKWEKEAQDAAERAEAEKNGEYQKLLTKAEQKAADAEAKLAQIEQSARARVLKSEIRSVAVELGFANPAVAFRLVDADAVDFDAETGEPLNVKKLLEQLAKDEPYLVKQAGSGAHIPPTARGSNLTPEQAMDANANERYDALKKSGRYVI
jgi:hypothetical protein